MNVSSTIRFRSWVSGRAAGVILGTAVAGVLATQARADSAQAGPVDQSNVLEEVTVTARRVEESIQRVPIAITALSAEDLRREQINSRDELAQNVAGLVDNAFSVAGGDRSGYYIIRGQGESFGGTPGVLTYFGDVPGLQLDNQDQGPLSIDGRPGTFIDLASVQVLKGPQGTLFGRNTTGGAVLFTPQRPTDSFEGYVSGSLGNYWDRSLEGAINIPLIPGKLAVRIAAGAEGRDGFVEDVGPLGPRAYENLNYQTVRASVLFTPTDNLENYLITRYYQSSDNGSVFVLSEGSPTTNPQFVGLAAQQQALGPWKVALGPLPPFDQTQYAQGINTTKLDLSKYLTIKNIVSYAYMAERFGSDVDGTVLPVLTQTEQYRPTPREGVFTEELQGTGKALDDHLTYTVGLYEDRADQLNPFINDFQFYPFVTPPFPNIPAGAVPGVAPVAGYPAESIFDGSSQSKAVYAQTSLDLGAFTPSLEGLSLTAGGRYTQEIIGTNSWTVLSDLEALHITNTYKNSYPSFTAGIDYQIDPRTLIYVSARDAFKSGGVNAQVSPSSQFSTFSPEKLLSYETGVKTHLHLGTSEIQLSTDYFYGDYTNIQRSVADISVAPAGFVENVAAAKIQGVEADVRMLLTRDFEVNLSYAYTDGSYTKVNGIAQSELLGLPLPYIAKNRITVAPEYRMAFVPESLGIFKVRVAYTYQSPITYVTAMTNPPSPVSPLIPGYGLLNGGFNWDHFLGHENLQFNGYVKNATNKEYVQGRFDFYEQAGFVSSQYGQPRTFGFELRYTF
jgi:iron complex outermembrane recepter protein